MATTWEIIDIGRNQSHAITVLFRETLEDGRVFTHQIVGGVNDTLADLRVKAKAKINQARVNRAKMDAIKAAFDSAQFEAFLNS